MLSLWFLLPVLLPAISFGQALEPADISLFGQAKEVVILTDDQDEYPLGLHLEYLEDPTGRLTIKGISSGAYEEQFVPGKTVAPRIGFSESAWWVRVRLRNDYPMRTDWRLVVQQPYIDFIDFYLPDNKGGFEVKQAGDLRPFAVREIEHRQAVFKVDMSPATERVLYLRIQSTGFILLDIALWKAEAFHAYTPGNQLFLGLFLGAVCIMAAFNLFLFWVLHDRAYLNYVLFLVFMSLHMATLEYGFTYQYLWPGLPGFNHTVTVLFPLFTFVFALNFTTAFLQTKTYTPKLHLCLNRLRLPYLISVPFVLLQLINWTQIGLALLTPLVIIVMMIAGVRVWRKGYRPARYYLLAWGMFWLNIIVLVAHLFGLIDTPIHLRMFPFAATFLVLFLSLALADRINVLKEKTERAKADADNINRQLEEQQQQLTLSENKYRTIFEESSDIIFITDLDGQIKDVSPACDAVLGYTRSEALNQNALAAYADPADRANFRELMLQHGSIRDFEIKLLRKDGREIDAEVSATLRHAEDDTITGFQGIIRDVTAHKQAEAEQLRTLELQSAKELADVANKTKSMFLANMSHELRTPLNAILGFSELMTRDHNLTLEQQQNLGTIGRSGEHLLALINDVLEFSKIEVGNIELRLERFDLQRMLVSLEEMFRIRAENKELALEIVSEANVPRLIRADQNKLRQVLINLLANAVEHTSKGSITLRVAIGSQKDALRFEVEDTGKGIAEHDLSSIFQAFFQSTENARSGHGTGLGLPISQEFVRMMGGELMVSSRVDKGTKFHFELTVKPVQDSSTIADKPIQRIKGLEPDQQIFRILVVEDNDINRELLVKLLQQVGFDTREAANGSAAIAEFEQWQPHLIWMDIRMPFMDGYEATRCIKEMPAGAETVIIALTASAFEENRLEALEQGCDDFVRKPFKENEIFEKMRQLLGVRYQYEDIPAKIWMAKNANRVKLTPELLLELPEDLRLELKNAVDAVDFEATMTTIKKMPAQNEVLADALTGLLNQYRFDRLQELLG